MKKMDKKNWAEKKWAEKKLGRKKKFGRKNLAEKILADILAATPTGPRHHTHQLFSWGFILFPKLPEKSNFAHRNSFFMSHVISLGKLFSTQIFLAKFIIFLSPPIV